MLRSLQAVLLLALSAVLLCAGVRGGWVVEDGKLTVQSIDGSQRLSDRFASPTPLSERLDLEGDDVIKLSFAVRDTAASASASGKTAVPQQAFISLVDNKSGQDYPVVANVKPSTGRATWSLRADRLPLPLTQTSGDVSVYIILGSFSASSSQTSEPLSYQLGRIRLPPAALRDVPTARQAAEKEWGFEPHPARFHTFATPPRMPPSWQSAAGVGAVCAPWLVLLALWDNLSPKLHAPTARTLPLLASLVLLEGLAAKYWIGMTLFQMLPWLIAGGLASLLAGREALSEARKRRLTGGK